MSNYNIYRTGKLTDKEVIKLFNAIEKELGFANASARAGQININYKDPESLKTLEKGDGFLITQAHIDTEKYKINIIFLRGIGRDSTNPNNAREASPYFDEIAVSYNKANTPNNERMIPSLQEINKCDSIIRKHITVTIPNNVGEGANNATDLLQTQISSLSRLHEEMINGIDKRRAQLDKEHDARIATLDKQHKSRLEALESKALQNEELHAKKVEALAKREEEIDNKDHMYARREQREKISEAVQTRLQQTIVSPSAHTMRWGVFALSILTGLFLAIISYQGLESLVNLITKPELMSAQEWSEVVSARPQEAVWFLIFKTFLSSIGAVAFVIYSITWLQKLYLDDVKTTRELEQYGYDINRASWAIETIMEMQVAKDLQPPQRWIDAVCGGLFNNKSKKDKEATSPIEALLNSSAKIELGTNGSKFELSSKGAKKLTKEAANS